MAISRLREIPFFLQSFNKTLNGQEYTEKAFNEFILTCTKYLMYEYFEPGECIFHKGAYGRKMYIIIDGNFFGPFRKKNRRGQYIDTKIYCRSGKRKKSI